MMLLLSSSVREKCPYKYMLTSLPRWFRLFFVRTSITFVAKTARCDAWRGHRKRKWDVSSLPVPQKQALEGVSLKLWLFLWLCNGLSPNLIWKRYFVVWGSWMLKILLPAGRKSETRWCFKTEGVGIVEKCVTILFQVRVASGKKLLLHLKVLQRCSCNDRGWAKGALATLSSLLLW